MPTDEAAPIICAYLYTAHRFHGRCERYGVEVGPFISRDQCEAAVVRWVNAKSAEEAVRQNMRECRVNAETCFRHEATTEAPSREMGLDEEAIIGTGRPDAPLGLREFTSR